VTRHRLKAAGSYEDDAAKSRIAVGTTIAVRRPDGTPIVSSHPSTAPPAR
jgi:hypothetical protein